MSDKYTGNEYDRQAQQSGQEFRDQAMRTGADYIKNHIGNTAGSASKEAAVGAAGSAASAAESSATGAAATGSSTASAAATAGTAGTATATGAATGGIGAFVALAISALKAGSDKAKAEMADISQETDISKESHAPLIIAVIIGVFIFICCIVLLIPSCAMFFPQLMERDGRNNSNIQQEAAPHPFFNAHSDKNEFFKQILGVDRYDVAADNIVQEYRQVDNTNIEIYKSIIDHAVYNAFNKHALSYCTDYDLLRTLDFIADADKTFEDKINYILFFDSEKALENYRSKRYPYTATHEDGSFYTIGDYLDGNIPDNEINNLINYAEIITVLSQSEDCAANSFSYSSFYDMLTSEKAEMLLFEIKFDQERTWSREVIEEGDSESNDGDQNEDADNGGAVPPEKEDHNNENKELDDPTKDTPITVTPVTPAPTIKPTPTATPRPVPTASPSGNKKDKDDDIREKDDQGDKSKNPGKHDKNEKNNKLFSMSIYSTGQRKYMAFGRKLYQVVLPPIDMGGGKPSPTPSPDPTPTPIPEEPDNGTDLETDPDDSLAEEITKNLIYKYGFFYDCEIAPYGLLELYTIADVDPDEMNVNEYTIRNIDTLDLSEKWLRTKISDVPLGPDERSPMQFLNSDLVSKGIDGLFSNHIYYKHAVDLKDQLSCDYIPDGQSVILDMQGYINQGRYPDSYRGTDGRGQSIKAAGCCDCSYTMIAMYFNRANYNIVSISKKYVTNNNFRGIDFLSSVGLAETVRDAAYSASSVIGYLTEGLPVMLHISGKWTYNGVTYHSSSNGHFLVIMGFDDKGFYVYDPGSNKNTTNGPIPYAAFSYVGGKSIRVITRQDNFVPHYLVNTYLEEI